MLERNGLRHGGFELHEKFDVWSDGKVRGMGWNADSEVLAVWVGRLHEDVSECQITAMHVMRAHDLTQFSCGLRKIIITISSRSCFPTNKMPKDFGGSAGIQSSPWCYMSSAKVCQTISY